MRKLSILMIAVVVFLYANLATACKDIDKENSSMINSNANLSSSMTESDDEAAYVNPLTGKGLKSDKILTKRPIAVMINNIKVSLPQRGISKADVIYELPVEGGITRMLAVFSDYTKLPEIGSIRSSRHDYLELIMPLDAIYVHFGGSKYAYSDIKKYGIDSIDGLYTSNVAFFQDTSRLYKGREHTWFTDFEHIKAGIKNNSTRTTLKDNKTQSAMFNFASKSNPIYKAESAATNVSVTFSNGVVATLDYDKKTKTYTKGQYGQPHMDEGANTPLKFTNGLILFAQVDTISNYGHRDIHFTSGDGYYITHGKYHSIKWSKKDEKSPIVYTNSDGSELVVNPGKSYIAVVPKENKGNTTFS